MSSRTTQIIEQLEQWLDNVVIGLNLCPFAARPRKQQRIDFHVCYDTQPSDILTTLATRIRWLENHPDWDTSIIALADGLQQFDDYNYFLDDVDLLLAQQQWQGIFQIASFHPDYQFAGTEPMDQENLTNRSPYPLLHILREEQLTDALHKYPNPESIPQRNIHTMNQLTAEQIKNLFPFLLDTPHKKSGR